MNHWTKYLSHRKRFRFDLRNIFLTMRVFKVKNGLLLRELWLFILGAQQSKLGSLNHDQFPAPPPKEI